MARLGPRLATLTHRGLIFERFKLRSSPPGLAWRAFTLRTRMRPLCLTCTGTGWTQLLRVAELAQN